MFIHISVLTVFEKLYKTFLQTSLIHRAHQKGIVHVQVNSFFSYASPKERIDASTFGPGAGMLIRPHIVEKAIEDKERQHGPAFKIFFSPQGEKLDQRLLERIAAIAQKQSHILLVPARYEGMDARVEEYYADMTLSVGDFVLMGGDIPAMMLLEGLLRLFPGVVGKKESVERESFSGPFVDFPAYTEPINWKGYAVPDIVRSGNHAAISRWRMQQAAGKTILHHFNWLRAQYMTDSQQNFAKTFIPPHYIVLFHRDILAREKKEAKLRSETLIDICDIICSAKMYGLKNIFVVIPPADQKKIMEQLLDFWQTGYESKYNKNRYEVIFFVKFYDSIDAVITTIAGQKGEAPLLIATSVKNLCKTELISFYDQSRIWELGRPILFVFGTDGELTDQLTERSDFLLPPIHGFSDFNYLPVGSAAAVIFDRWFGINLKNVKKRR